MRPRAPRTKRKRASQQSPPSRASLAARVPLVGRKRAAFPVVGIGASAGGLEAMTQLLEHLPPDTGMAFVLIQHLDPEHDSMLARALSRATEMTIVEITDGLSVEPNHVYVIPASADVAILHGTLTLLPRGTDGRRPHLPIDLFFRALAADVGNQAIGVVLSGTASDGTAGLTAIKAQDGIALVQEPSSAKFPGMPQSAIDAGVADAALTPAQLAAELTRLAHHPYIANHSVQSPGQRNDETLSKIFVLLRNAIGVDFSE